MTRLISVVVNTWIICQLKAWWFFASLDAFASWNLKMNSMLKSTYAHVHAHKNTLLFFFNLFKCLFILRECVSRGEEERKRENPKQAPCCQQKAQHGARTHEPWDHDLSWNQESMLNWLSHPVPPSYFSTSESGCILHSLNRAQKFLSEFNSTKNVLVLRREGRRKHDQKYLLSEG